LLTKATIALLMIAGSAWPARQPFTPDDLWNWRTPSDAQISPDGRWVVYVEGWNDQSHDAPWTNLRMISSDGKIRGQVTDGPWRDIHPRWSPDSTHVAWVSDRGGVTRIWVVEWGRTPAVPSELQVGMPAKPESFAWSPEGDRIAFTASEPSRPAPAPWAPPEILANLWPRESRVQLFVVKTTSGDPRKIATNQRDLRGEPAWTPNGQSILTAAADGQIYAIRVSDGTARQLTHTSARNEHPIPSPDGNRIAWLATADSHQSYAVRRLFAMNADSSRVKELSGSLDRDASFPQWSSDSRTVYFLADDQGATHIYAARGDGTVRQVTKAPERLRGFSLADNGRAAAVRSTALDPTAVVTFAVDQPSEPARLAGFNEALLAEREAGAVEEIHYDSGGHSIQAWLVKPPGFDPKKQYPLLIDVRDFPRSPYGFEFQLRAQMFAGQGFVVLCANPRGTPGYGETFGNLLPSRFPGDDADDLLRGVDFAVAKGYIDAHRLMLSGGLLAAWMIGHTDRFHSAAASQAIADWVTNVGTAPDGPHRAAAWMGAMPWDDPDQYVKHSPLFSAQGFHTPTLVLGGDRDPQSDLLYFALQARRVESYLVRLPDSRGPSVKVFELKSLLSWFGR
jgi:dipeptidyl aminopeptidase/acylaminoacyl peptidase